MNTKLVRFAGSASILVAASIGLFLPGCSAPLDAESVGGDEAATPSGEEEVGSTSDALVSKWQAACLLATATDYVGCYKEVSDNCIFASNLPFSGPGATDAECYAAAEKQCRPGKDKADLACASQSPTIYRVFSKAFFPRHIETKVPGLGTVEASYKFSMSPVAGADSRPIRRCQAASDMDFLSVSSNCEGKPVISGIEGYSYASTTPGARAVYRCRAGDDHFISTRSDCEGRAVEGLFGYAK